MVNPTHGALYVWTLNFIRIRARQNPQNCSTAKILYCSNDQHVGWCAMVHKVLYCLLVGKKQSFVGTYDPSEWQVTSAFHSGRSLVLDEQYYKISKYFELLNPKACPDLYKSLSQSHLPELVNDSARHGAPSDQLWFVILVIGLSIESISNWSSVVGEQMT